MMHLMQAKGFKAPGAFPDGPDPLGPILDRGGGPRATAGAPRAATGAPRAPTGPKDTKLNGLGLFDEANEKLDVKPELKMAANGRTTMQQQLSNAQGWRDNETTLPFYDNDNNRAAQWPPKVTAEGHYVTLPPPPPPLPLDPLSPPFPAAAAAGVGMGVGEGSGRVGQSSYGGISVIRTAADMVRTRSAGAGATRGAVGAGPGPGGGSSVRSSGQRQRGHRGGRQREKTPTFISEEEKLNWEKERRKKDIHNKVEQRRRYNINDRIQDLGNLLISGGLEVRQSKGAILRETIQYIRTLHSEQVRLGNFESFNGKLEIENNKLFSQIQRIEMLLQAHGYQTTAAAAATTGHQQQLYATEDNQQLHHSDLVSPNSYFSALKEETLTSEQYHHHQQHHHHHTY